ncbi:nucleotidyltransferase domain-containing protein [Hymenobacter sp. IS2118]|uniref:nucleotidyltransferase domain-containing protein n=1 Tax=Hymenobacter sp. IS2118 TaxID=1505605 RepID=UPI00055287F7|nr:nucleotidyltransferase domain-containing protein [Hymenobacter sp. IS2118]
MITEEQIQAVVQRIVEGYAPDRIILFGSYAYGVPTEDSDLDLLIIKRDAEEKRVARAIAVRTLLWGTDAPAMDILIRTPAEMERAAGVFQSVETIAEQQGRLLYAA